MWAFDVLATIASEAGRFVVDFYIQWAKVIASAYSEMWSGVSQVFTAISSNVAHGVAMSVNAAIRLINQFTSYANAILPDYLNIASISEFAVPAAQSISNAFDSAFSETMNGWKNLWDVVYGSFLESNNAMDNLVSSLEETRLWFVAADVPNYLNDTTWALWAVSKSAKEAGESAKALNETAKWWAEKTNDELKKLEENYKQVAEAVNKSARKEIDDTQDIVDAIEGHIQKIDELKTEYKDLAKEANKAISDINKEIWNVQDDRDKDLATRFVEIGSELAKLYKDKAESKENGWEWLQEINDQIEALESERAFAIENTTKAARDAAIAWSNMSESQKILAESQDAVTALEVKRDALVAEYQAKLENLQQQALAEQQALEAQKVRYQSQVDLIRGIFTRHFWQLEADARGSALALVQQYDIIAEKLNSLDALQGEVGISASSLNSSSNWGEVVSNGNSQQIITINLWGITISNAQDEKAFIALLEKSIVKASRNLSMWVT